MSRRTLLAECQRAAPGERWEIPAPHTNPRTRRTVDGVAMLLSVEMEPRALRRLRRGEPAAWRVQALEWRSGDYNPEGPLRVAHSRGSDLATALDEAAAELAAKCAGGST